MKKKQKIAPIVPQKILVFHQRGSGDRKTAGIRKYGGDLFHLETFSIDIPLPAVIDNSNDFLPKNIAADLVLDFLRHPDLSMDLARLCVREKIPIIASGKKYKLKGCYTPPT